MSTQEAHTITRAQGRDLLSRGHLHEVGTYRQRTATGSRGVRGEGRSPVLSPVTPGKTKPSEGLGSVGRQQPLGIWTLSEGL